MGNNIKHLGDLFMRDEHGDFHKVGEFKEIVGPLDSDKALEIASAVEQTEIIPDGINIHITGAEIERIDNVCIYFKTKEEK